MSATRDASQRIAFVYSNLYQIYKDGAAEARASSPGLETGFVIKAGQAAPFERAIPPPAPRTVRTYTPAELIGKRLTAQGNRLPAQGLRVARPESIAKPSLENLKQSLKNLNDLHARLKFMLAELEELTRE